MRTTVEIRDDQRGRLLEVAASRGEKGFSSLVQEALDRFLAVNADREKRVRAALSVLGTLDAESAEALEVSVRKLRASWR